MIGHDGRFHGPSESTQRQIFAPPTRWSDSETAADNILGLDDKLVLAGIYASIIWLLDHSLTFLAGEMSMLQVKSQATILIGFFLFATCAPFFLIRSLFRLSSWRARKHELSDRILVAVLGVTLQLGFDVICLQWVGAGKMLMSAIYAIVSCFGAIVSFRPKDVSAEHAWNSSQRPKTLQKITQRIVLGGFILTQCAKLLLSILKPGQNQPSAAPLVYGGLFFVGIVIAIALFSFSSSRDLQRK